VWADHIELLLRIPGDSKSLLPAYLNQFDMDAGLSRCDVCDFSEVVDPFWNAVHQLGMALEVAQVFD